MKSLSLVVEDVRKTFPRAPFALEVDRIEAAAGRTLALLGPSGSGKTTLLHVMGLLERPDRGRVLLGGQEVRHGDRAAQLRMAAVMQRPYLFKGSVRANVEYGLVARGVARSEREPRVQEALGLVGLAGYADRGAFQLSGGEAQRVSLARALVLEPSVLLLDEPLASLDVLLKRRLAEDFARIVHDSNATVVWVTHDQDEALMVADHVTIMNGGRVVTSGSADAVMGLPADGWTAAFLGVEPPHQGSVVSSADGLVRIASSGQLIEAAGVGVPGDQVIFAIRPEDLILFEEGVELPLTTARNRLQATVASCRSRGAVNHIVLDVGGLTLAAAVSRAATVDLGLGPGQPVQAVFKASAVRWRTVADAETDS